MTWVIDGASATAQQAAPAPPICGQGSCVIIANLSPSDTLYYSSDKQGLESAKSQGNLFGIPLLAGEKNIIPWVTTPLYVINFNAGSTPQDLCSCETWA
jgi:hypothetical protein